MRLTKQQQEGLQLIIDTFNNLYPPIYRGGAKEHGGYIGDLSPLQLAHNILEEGMDTVAYAVHLIEQLEYHEE